MQATETPPRRKRKRRSMPGKIRRLRKRQLVELYGLSCYWCNKPLTLENFTMDHFIPVCEGGKNSAKNLRMACVPCNYGRHVKREVAVYLYYRTLMESEEIIRNRLLECRQKALKEFIEFLGNVLTSNGFSLDDLHSALEEKTQQKSEINDAIQRD